MSDDRVIGVIEFGSTARGDADEFSDRDVFVVVDNLDIDTIDRLRTGLASRYRTDRESVSCYSASSFDKMITQGSLFAWHLWLEGTVLEDPDDTFNEAFAHLAPYADYKKDINRFDKIYHDSCASYDSLGELDTFEMHVLFVVARNICMLLTAWSGHPAFGRRAVVPAARIHYADLPLSDEAFDVLTNGHLGYIRNIPIALDERGGVDDERIVAEVGELMKFALAVMR